MEVVQDEEGGAEEREGYEHPQDVTLGAVRAN